MYIAIQQPASANQADRLSILEHMNATPAAMGGAYTAVPGGPAAMFWNPSAAMITNRLSISGTHSLRHFPGDRKNLDQFDADTVGAVIPIAGDNVLGLGFTIPGEWGIDYSDTNGLLKRDGSGWEKPDRLRGGVRRVSVANVHPDAGGRGIGSEELSSEWLRAENGARSESSNALTRGGGLSFFYQDDNGFSYGVNFKLKKRKGAKSALPRLAGEARLGVAYRHDPASDTLAALDIEARSAGAGRIAWKYYAGIERSRDRDVFARAGLMNGNFTYGGGARLSHLRLDYAVVRGLLPLVSGENPRRFEDGHFLSYTLTD